jgi:hypothetical protein
MPLNESRGVTRSNLTPQQKREAEAALYGLPLQERSTMAPGHLTHEELERMRMILLQHDQAEQTGRGIQSFDLNNPPKVPYRFKEFPRCMYRDGQSRAAHNEEEVQTALAQGWSKDPAPVPFEAPALEPEAAAEAAAVDAKLAELRKPKKERIALVTAE